MARHGAERGYVFCARVGDRAHKQIDGCPELREKPRVCIGGHLLFKGLVLRLFCGGQERVETGAELGIVGLLILAGLLFA